MAGNWPNNWRLKDPFPDISMPRGRPTGPNGQVQGAFPEDMMLDVMKHLRLLPQRRNNLFTDHTSDDGSTQMRRRIRAWDGILHNAFWEHFTSTTTFVVKNKNVFQQVITNGKTFFVAGPGSSEAFVQFLKDISPERAALIRHIAIVDYSDYAGPPAEQRALADYLDIVLKDFMHKLALETVGVFHCMRCFRMEDKWFQPFNFNKWQSRTNVRAQGLAWADFEEELKSMRYHYDTYETTREFEVIRECTQREYGRLLTAWRRKRAALLAEILGGDEDVILAQFDTLGGDLDQLYSVHGVPQPGADDGIGDVNDPENPTTQQIEEFQKHARLTFKRKVEKIHPRKVQKVRSDWRKKWWTWRYTGPKLRERTRLHSYADGPLRHGRRSRIV